MKEEGIVPIIVAFLVAAVAAIVGITSVARTKNITVPQLVQTILQPAPTTVTQSASYSVQGTSIPSNILVKFKDGTSDTDIANVHNELGTKTKKTIKGINVEVVELPQNVHAADYVNKFKNKSVVQYAEQDFIAKSFFTPNDQYFPNQWNLQKINAPKAWDNSQGGFGPVAIVDSGIDTGHPDLSGEVLNGYNFVANSTDTNDDNGHGTHVAGIIEATTNNGIGVASVGFKGTLLPVKVLDSTGTGNYSNIANGIVYATDNGARIINLSLGGSSYSQTLQDAVNYATSHGVYVVAAAGNNGNTAAVYPADNTGVLAVSASAQDDSLASFSSFGPSIFVAAPGVNITSTYNNGGYAQMSGTSMSAPHLSGLIALGLSYKNIPVTDMLNDLKASSDKVGPYPYDQNGWNEYFGYGRIDAGNLLTLLSSTPTPTPTSAPTFTPSPVLATPNPTPQPTVPISFTVDLEGTVDHVDLSNSKISVKVLEISQNVAVTPGNLVDLFFNPNTKITLDGQSSNIYSITAGQKINSKATWSQNKLTAISIDLQYTPTTEPQPTPQPQNRQQENTSTGQNQQNIHIPDSTSGSRVKGLETANSFIENVILQIKNIIASFNF